MRQLLLICFIVASSVAAHAKPIYHMRPESDEDERGKYFLQILRLALEKTKSAYGDFDLRPSSHQANQARFLELLADQGSKVDVIWTMTSKTREDRFQAIRVPLLKGLMGYRIALVRASDRDRFQEVSTIEDLKKYKFGQGQDWPDTKILVANGLELVTSTTYEGLFRMLSKGRFDLFPRSFFEPWEEVNARASMNLAIEPRLLIRYTSPIYFFVGKHNKELAKRIRTGLDRAIDDGDFDKIFFNHDAVKTALKQSNLSGRNAIELINPFLPPKTPIKQSKYWYKLKISGAK